MEERRNGSSMWSCHGGKGTRSWRSRLNRFSMPYHFLVELCTPFGWARLAGLPQPRRLAATTQPVNLMVIGGLDSLPTTLSYRTAVTPVRTVLLEIGTWVPPPARTPPYPTWTVNSSQPSYPAVTVNSNFYSIPSSPANKFDFNRTGPIAFCL